MARRAPGKDNHDPKQVGLAALRAVNKLGELCPQTDPHDVAAAIDVATEAIFAIAGKASAIENVRTMHAKLVGSRDAYMGEFVFTFAKAVRAAKDDEGRRDAADLLVGSLEQYFDESYRALREPRAFEKLVDLLGASVLHRPKRGEHTIGHATLEIQRLAGKPRSRSKPETSREAIDDVLKKRFR